MQSSVADVVYEAKREARERRPGDRVADAFPAIAPKLDDVSRERRRLVSGESVLRALPQKDDAPPAPRAALPRATALPAAAVADAVADAVDGDAPSAAGSFLDALKGAASELRAYTPEDGERATRERLAGVDPTAVVVEDAEEIVEEEEVVVPEAPSNLRPKVKAAVEAAAAALDAAAADWLAVDDDERAATLGAQLASVAAFLGDREMTFAATFNADAAEVLRLRRLAIASAFAEVVPIVTPERAERFAAALRGVLDVEER